MRGQHKQSQWYDSYRYLGRDLKQFWNRNGSKICTIAGTTGLFLTTAHACKKTYRIHDKLKSNGHYISSVKEANADEKWIKRTKEMTKAYAKCSAKTVKHYLPDIVGGVLSAFCVSKGWNIEHSHYKEATAMVGVIAGSFMNYRQNVIAELGEDADRRYLTTKREKRAYLHSKSNDGAISESSNDESSDGEGIVLNVEPNLLKIFYSKETTPQVWSPSHIVRLQYLDGIESKLNNLLICGGHYTVNDVRREFYGVKGDKPAGAIFGRVWDPGNPEHPERGARVNLHYMDDEDFAIGLKDSCWIIIDIDDEPLLESLKSENLNDIPGIEV